MTERVQRLVRQHRELEHVVRLRVHDSDDEAVVLSAADQRDLKGIVLAIVELFEHHGVDSGVRAFADPWTDDGRLMEEQT
jgi:hypothetical protein